MSQPYHYVILSAGEPVLERYYMDACDLKWLEHEHTAGDF